LRCFNAFLRMFFAEGKKISFQCAKIAMLQRVFAHIFCRRQKDFIYNVLLFRFFH